MISHYFAVFAESRLKTSHLLPASAPFPLDQQKKCGSWVRLDWTIEIQAVGKT